MPIPNSHSSEENNAINLDCIHLCVYVNNIFQFLSHNINSTVTYPYKHRHI